MLTNTQIEMIQKDFEKYYKSLKTKGKSLDFELFGEYATSILNFYLGSSVLTISDKPEAAKILVNLFNAGLGNVINKEDQNEIALVIQQDNTLDYSVIQPIFEL
jgi:hypothetical protein